MEPRDIKWCPQHGYSLPCNKCGLGLFEAGYNKALAQLAGMAEECKQQGRREVVEWVKTHSLIAPDKNSITRFEPFYQITQVELKEW